MVCDILHSPLAFIYCTVTPPAIMLSCAHRTLQADTMLSRKLLILGIIAASLLACSNDQQEPPSERVNAISSDFVNGYYAQYPEEIYEVGFPNGPTDRFGDHSASARAAWDKRVDQWLADLDAIDVSLLAGTPEAITYVFTRERLQAIVDQRVCHIPFWNISPTWTGWQSSIIATLAGQPVGNADERRDALARLADIERFLQTEIKNLQAGLDKGYLAPTNNVAAVVQQMDTLLASATDDSPFFSPASRSDNDSFVASYRDTFEKRVRPAIVAYRDFLKNDYSGRAAIGVAANPDGEQCYAASVRYWSSLAMDPMDIHRKGLAEMSRIRAEMLEIAQTSFGTDDLRALFNELRSNPEYTFASEQAMLDYVNAAVERGRDEVTQWFGYVPDVDVQVVPSPAYEKDSGGGFYAAGSADGSRPGTYQVGTYNPTSISKAGTEATAFHESYPGHHLQVSIALLNDSLPPALRFMYVSGTVEGWGLYAERLADEMGLYSSDLARLGMLSNEAYRAARLVVDPGMHVLGWTRQQAIDYMLEHTAEGLDSISGEVDRYAAVPGQATSYLVGSLEIQRLRQHAETLLGDKFDIREFHDRILANGGVTLPMLGTTVDEWISEVLADST